VSFDVCPNCGVHFEQKERGRDAIYCSRTCQVRALNGRGNRRTADASRTQMSIRIPNELRERLKAAADERDLGMNYLAVRAITEFLDRLVPVEDIRWTRSPEAS
jgi:predicted HicB family RNase H-like nuclease